MNFEKIGEERKQIIDQVGECPLTCMDALEALRYKDCLGICLKISRGEGAIMDPTLVKIHDIIPTFMSVNAYLDSAGYQLERDGDHNTLAMGVAREDVNGILPLYLFREHWSIARNIAPSVFGLMSTLDIMGYQAL